MRHRGSLTDIGTTLREAREAAGKSQDEVARLLGVARSTISRIEFGKVTPSWSMVMAISEALNLQPILVPHAKARAVEALLLRSDEAEAPPLIGEEW